VSSLCNVTAVAITDCPSFVGPVYADCQHTQIEFHCDVITDATDPRWRFNVYFLFNFEVDSGVPVQELDLTNLRATLHERYLARRLNKAVRCVEFLYVVQQINISDIGCGSCVYQAKKYLFFSQ